MGALSMISLEDEGDFHTIVAVDDISENL